MRLQQAYVDDLERQMSLDLAPWEQRECAAFLYTALKSLEDHFADAGCARVQEFVDVEEMPRPARLLSKPSQ